MKKILSCDWGTTSFRLRLVDAGTGEVIAKCNNSQGIAGVYALWQKAGEPEINRFRYYYEIIQSCIKQLENKIAVSLDNVTLVISGMASSNMGMIELPYKDIPFVTDGSDLEIKVIKADKNFKRKTIIISGVRTGNDVMRGEETKITGCSLETISDDHLFILPGTHPKHIRIQGNKVTGLTTYMTGEYFELLSIKSILSGSVIAGGDFNREANKCSFENGVQESMHSNLLHNSFLIRTNALFKKYTPEENYFYLSGLLIGTELKDLQNAKYCITLLGDAKLNGFYAAALKRMNIIVAGIENADDALIRGQVRIGTAL